MYLTPDSDRWDPNSLDYSEQEKAMLDADGYIVDRSPSNRMIVDNIDVNLNALYVEPPTWDQIKLVIGAVIAGNKLDEWTAREPPTYDVDNVSFSPTLFSCWILERAEQSSALEVIGSCTVNQEECEIFVKRIFLDGDPHVLTGAATAGKS